MGYYPSEPASSKGDPTAKNRVWGFFAESVSVNLETRRAALETHRENYGESRKPASGIPLWPSRDPIEEFGGVNLYGFVGNEPIWHLDYLGLSEICELVSHEIVERSTPDTSGIDALTDFMTEMVQGAENANEARDKIEEQAEKMAEKAGRKTPRGGTAAEVLRHLLTEAIDDAGDFTEHQANEALKELEKRTRQAEKVLRKKKKAYYLSVTVICVCKVGEEDEADRHSIEFGRDLNVNINPWEKKPSISAKFVLEAADVACSIFCPRQNSALDTVPGQYTH
ncbi:hypothetical protein ACFQY0_20675 [Haloferula chungangensis]|uniref:RHS repeat-associated core domain-containing protein n=1 Tax=Haloferula chungangensis TaxID=1048331 RepID=A0ABW2LF33_9BACT